MTAPMSMSHHETAVSVVAAVRADAGLPELVERVVAAAGLFCHPNAVRYRLRRIEAGTGRTPGNPGDVAELVTAVRAWRELPHS